MPQGDPTAPERADLVVTKLEKFIRDNKGFNRGMSFRTWQDMARVEITKAIHSAEGTLVKVRVENHWLLVILASTLVTVGFWGTVVAVDRSYGIASAIIIGLAGLVLFIYLLSRTISRLTAVATSQERKREMRRIQNLMREIRMLRRELEKQKKQLEKEVERQAAE